MTTTDSGGRSSTARRTGLLLVAGVAVALLLTVWLVAYNHDGADDVANSGPAGVEEPVSCEEGDSGEYNVAAGAEC